MNKKTITQFKEAVENVCGEADEAARLSVMLFNDEELKIVRRELARLMEIIDDKILPIYESRYSTLDTRKIRTPII